MPLGTPDKVNKAGVKYYMNLLKELRSNGIEARVTLYHWDLPQTFAQQGGWLNSTIKQWFADYARFCFKQFGKYVNEWYTINEPPLICHSGYGLGLEAPGIQSPGVGEYICSKNTLLAHAAAWRIYDTEFRPRQKGRINIVLETTWYEPDTGDKDKAAAERRLQFEYGLYAHPIFRGNWPQVVIDRVALRSKLEGYPQSRLPELTAEEQHFIKDTYDYLTINHYAALMAKDIPEPSVDGGPDMEKDSKVSLFANPAWKKTEFAAFQYTPIAFGSLLRWLNRTYQPKQIEITENGLPDSTITLDDDDRIDFLRVRTVTLIIINCDFSQHIDKSEPPILCCS
nr:unnamed protein product [Callosobruchus analis]